MISIEGFLQDCFDVINNIELTRRDNNKEKEREEMKKLHNHMFAKRLTHDDINLIPDVNEENENYWMLIYNKCRCYELQEGMNKNINKEMKEEISNLEKRLANYQTQNKKQVANIKRLAEENEKLVQENTVNKDIDNKVKAMISELEEKVDDYKTKNNNQMTKIIRLNEEKEKLTNEIQSLKEQVKTLSEANENYFFHFKEKEKNKPYAVSSEYTDPILKINVNDRMNNMIKEIDDIKSVVVALERKLDLLYSGVKGI